MSRVVHGGGRNLHQMKRGVGEVILVMVGRLRQSQGERGMTRESRGNSLYLLL